MMNLQYIADKFGHTTAVQLQIPIEEWNNLKSKYKEFEEEEIAASLAAPDWHNQLVSEELKNIADGTIQLQDWKEVKKRFNR